MPDPRTPWFRPKSHGWGAYPITWQGWAMVVGYVAAVVVLGIYTFGQEHTAPWIWAVFVAVVTVLTLGLIAISRRRTEGEWRWRWGEENQEDMKVKR